jgi:hypothetical protein
MWAWDVAKLQFFAGDDLCEPVATLSSGEANMDYAAARAVMGPGVWGGRKDEPSSSFFLGAVFDRPMGVTGVHFSEPNDKHCSLEGRVILQCSLNDIWTIVPSRRKKDRNETTLLVASLGSVGDSDTDEASSTQWRIHAAHTYSDWAWDVAKLQFFAGDDLCEPVATLSSGEANMDYAAARAVMGPGVWGGRKDEPSSSFFLGAVFDRPMGVTGVHFSEPNDKHCSVEGNVTLQRARGSEWVDVRLVQVEERGDRLPSLRCREGQIPADSDLVAVPSRPLQGKVHNCCYRSQLHDRGVLPSDPFLPSSDFYLSEDCEGLWVCVSRACGEATLQKASQLVRSFIPEEHRRLWGQFASPLWAKDRGPMRLVVLDNVTNEQCGMIPELSDISTGRNCTSCPFVVTSREDLFDGVGGWTPGRLTLHEMTHGADMVIRQQLDPAFEDIVEDLFRQYRQLCCYTSRNGAMKSVYAATSRDEFLAEMVTASTGRLVCDDGYFRCGLNTVNHIREAMPELYDLMKRYFNFDVPVVR